jgi:hypothetical protein
MTTTQTKNSYFTPARDDVEGDIRKAEENLSDLVARLTERMHNMDADRDEDGDPTNERYTAIEEAIEELEAVARSLDSAADTLAVTDYQISPATAGLFFAYFLGPLRIPRYLEPPHLLRRPGDTLPSGYSLSISIPYRIDVR